MYETMNKQKSKRERSANNTGIPNAKKEKFEQRQEKHPAHEFEYIVQQKQEIVRPTRYLNEIPLNNDPALEQDADIISSISTPTDSSQSRIVQAFSAQWNDDEDGEVIQNIQFDRPPISVLNERVLFPNWLMSSSHTTAFVVIRRELELRLCGKTYYQALREIQQMTLNIRTLPGYIDMPTAPNPDLEFDHSDDRPRVDKQINDIVQGIQELLTGVNVDTDSAPFQQISRNMMIKGYAEAYFICRNSIYYSFHTYGNGGGANDEADSIASLENVPDVAAGADLREDPTLKQAYMYAIALLDINHIDEEDDEAYEDMTPILKQHFLSIASFFASQGKNGLKNKFMQVAQDSDLMTEIMEVYGTSAADTDYQPDEGEEG